MAGSSPDLLDEYRVFDSINPIPRLNSYVEDYIEQNYISMSNAEMAKNLNCSIVTIARKLRKMGLNRKNLKYFIDKAKIIHGDRYDYSRSEYINARTDIIINCPTHGDYLIKPHKHLSGQKCYRCAKEDSGRKNSKGLSKFIREAMEIHGNRYDYSSVVYKTQESRINILCPEHGLFVKTAKSHIVCKAGCPKCSRELNSGWTTADWEKRITDGKTLKLYYLECWNDDEQFYKIGLTCKDEVKYRFLGKDKMPYNYRIIWEIGGEVAELVKLERLFKKKIIALGDKYIPRIKFSGSTYECFKGMFSPDEYYHMIDTQLGSSIDKS